VGVAVAFTVVEIGKWGGAVLSPTCQFPSQEVNLHDEAVVFLLCLITIGVTVKIPSTQGNGMSAFCSATVMSPESLDSTSAAPHWSADGVGDR
jgi:hypothetical protein